MWDSYTLRPLYSGHLRDSEFSFVNSEGRNVCFSAIELPHSEALCIRQWSALLQNTVYIQAGFLKRKFTDQINLILTGKYKINVRLLAC